MTATPPPTDLHAALLLLRDELPQLMDKPNWDTLPQSFREAERRLGSDDAAKGQEAAAEIWQHLDGHDAARDEVRAWADELGDLRRQLAPLVAKTIKDAAKADRYATDLLREGIRSGAVVPAEESGKRVRTRGGTIAPFGERGAITRKARNLVFHPKKVAEFVGHSTLFALSDVAVLIAVSGLSLAAPFLIGLNVLLLANCVMEAVTIDIPEHDATVLWGLMQAQKRPGNTVSAPEPDVVAVTNSERALGGFGDLKPQDVARSLKYLEKIGCVKKVVGNPDRWRLIEEFKVKG